MTPLVVGGLGTTELLIIFAVLILFFGPSKLPELAHARNIRASAADHTRTR